MRALGWIVLALAVVAVWFIADRVGQVEQRVYWMETQVRMRDARWVPVQVPLSAPATMEVANDIHDRIQTWIDTSSVPPVSGQVVPSHVFKGDNSITQLRGLLRGIAQADSARPQ